MARKKKTRRGRPRLDDPKKKRYFRATDSQWRRWKSIAGDTQMGVWIRQVLDRAKK